MTVWNIKIKGGRVIKVEETLEIRLLIDRWSLYRKGESKNEVAKVEGWIGTLSAIEDFFQERDEKQNSRGVPEDTYPDARRAILALTLDDRARRLGFFRLLYWAFTGKNSEEEKIEHYVAGKPYKIEELAVGFQKKFFREHPKRILPDPQIFKKIIPRGPGNAAAIGAIERSLQKDMSYEK